MAKDCYRLMDEMDVEVTNVVRATSNRVTFIPFRKFRQLLMEDCLIS